MLEALSRRLCFSALVLTFAACGDGDGASPSATLGQDANPDASPKLEKIVLQTDWYAQPEHGGFYHAKTHGYYRDAGLDVEIRPGANLTNIQQIVAMKRADFAIGTSDNLMVAVSRGLPLVAVFPYFQHDPQCLMVHEDSPVETVADLEGREVMAQPSLGYIEYIQKELGISLQLLPMNYGLARFLNDEDFIQQCFLTSEPYYVREKGVAVRTIPLSTSGFDPYRLVYTYADLVEKRPDVVRAFASASLQGWIDYLAGPGRDATNAAIMASNSQQSPDFMAWTVDAILGNSLVTGQARAGDEFGRFDPARLTEQAAQLDRLELLDRPVSVEAVFPPAFLDSIAVPSPEALEAVAAPATARNP